MPSFLLELFSEEIPARMQKAAMEHLFKSLSDALVQAGLGHGKSQPYGTPRRVAVLMEDIAAVQPDVTVEKKGPKTTAPQAAIDGFLKSSGLTLDQCEKRMVGKDETYFAVIHQKGQPTETLLKGIIEKILAEFPWPKSMRWGSGETRWVRPLHSILCLFDGKVIPLEFAGVTSSNVTYGHRFLAPAAITITSESDYETKLKNAYVIANRDRRLQEIAAQADNAATKQNLQVKFDQGLLEEVTGLVEWPVVLVGSIDAKFMDLPPEVLTSEMRAHQKYFTTHNKGVFSDKFIITSNMITSDGGKAVIAGNERVLRARLADGRFFWDQDRKKPLSDWAEGLKGVTFHAKIGTIADKVERIKRLAVALTKYVPAADAKLTEKAAALCKADLVTGMVGEFPELQGVMGRYYAIQQKEDAAVADAIRDHYLPLGPDSPVPTAPVSICVALADKLDTLISMFAAGEKPTGSKDPFALRRSALGIIRIILENSIRFNLNAILSAAKDLDASASPQHDVIVKELIAFFSDRLKVMLKDQGIRHDIISAVMAGGDDDLVRVVARAKALQEFLATENGVNLLAGYRRASNIVTAEEKKSGKKYAQVDSTLFEVEEEKQLSTALATNLKKVDDALKNESFADAMAALATLRTPVDDFFEKVMVNVEKEKLRETRLGLLNAIRDVVNRIADFSQIEG